MTASQLELPLSSADTPVFKIWVAALYDGDGHIIEEHYFMTKAGADAMRETLKKSKQTTDWVDVTEETVYA